MAKLCVQCDKKIGMFKTPIDGIYCSYECRDAGRRDIADNERRAVELKAHEAESQRASEVAAATQAAQTRAQDAVKRACPKCGAAWRYAAGGGSAGLDLGECGKCGFSAQFNEIEKCPTCTSMSLVVDGQGARCPRCKFRR
jgi:hypothetical protein